MEFPEPFAPTRHVSPSEIVTSIGPRTKPLLYRAVDPVHVTNNPVIPYRQYFTPSVHVVPLVGSGRHGTSSATCTPARAKLPLPGNPVVATLETHSPLWLLPPVSLLR